MPQCNTCKPFFKNIYNHISQSLCHHDLTSKQAASLLHGDNQVHENSSSELCCDDEDKFEVIKMRYVIVLQKSPKHQQEHYQPQGTVQTRQIYL